MSSILRDCSSAIKRRAVAMLETHADAHSVLALGFGGSRVLCEHRFNRRNDILFGDSIFIFHGWGIWHGNPRRSDPLGGIYEHLAQLVDYLSNSFSGETAHACES